LGNSYKNGACTYILNVLYWNTIIENSDELSANGRMHFVTAQAKKISIQEQKDYKEKANNFLDTL